MIKIVLTDCDGCLTNGKVSISNRGTRSKTFDCKDGLGFLLLKENNIKVGVVSCYPSSPILGTRFRDVHLDFIIEGVHHRKKMETIGKILRESSLGWDELAYMGDDVSDLETIGACGTSFCPSDAIDIVLKSSTNVCKARGGDGAFREMCDRIINKQQ